MICFLDDQGACGTWTGAPHGRDAMAMANGLNLVGPYLLRSFNDSGNALIVCCRLIAKPA
jgi:hypothetical protein